MKLTTVLVAVAAAAIMLAPVSASAKHWNHGWHHGWQPHHGWHNHWRHGMVVPFGWRHYAFVDWRLRHLHDPGRYHWVFVDDQYVLMDDRGFIVEVYGN